MLPRLCLLAVLLAPGCAGFLPSDTNKLSSQAEALRAAQPVAVALPRELDKQLSEPYVVEPGDVLLLQPTDYDSTLRFPGDQAVLPDGTLNLGKYGRVVAAGKTLDQLEAAVREAIQARDRDRDHGDKAGDKEPPGVTARVVTRQSKVYYVLGEVNAPGAYILTGRESVLDAILQAGDLNDRADPEGILLTPADAAVFAAHIVLPVCFDAIVQIGDTSTNYQIKAGDRIFVPARSTCDTFGLSHKKPACTPCNRPQQAALLPPETCHGPAACVGAVVPLAPPPTGPAPSVFVPARRPEPLPPPKEVKPEPDSW